MSTMPSIITKFVDYYAELDNQSPSSLAELYHPAAELTDPFGQHQGLLAIQHYFTRLLDDVKHCHFDIDPPLCAGPRFAVTWTMNWAHPRISRGKTLILPGCSMVEVDNNLIIHQRDYYDAGEMIYEHLPLLGCAVRSVKRRLRA